MKFSEAWLREWVNPELSREELADRLTMTGLEVEGSEPVAGQFEKVVIGKVLSLKKHPTADQLQLCEVDVGLGAPLAIACGASNVKKSMKVAVALIDAVLPNNLVIKEAEVRGVRSQGMLCSAEELGISDESEGLLELPTEAPLGQLLWNYLKLSDHSLEVSITPNRGDCLSIKGMARELAAITRTSVKKIALREVPASIPDLFPVSVEAQEACPSYIGRVIRGVKKVACTPVWMKERLRRSGLRSIHPIVDVTNYVMLELGQPMHAFDLARLDKGIYVRMAKPSEELVLLDNTTVKLTGETLIIADGRKPLAIAGVMGGIDSGISEDTQDLFLESAFFHPTVISRQRQAHQLNSESSYRFERGVDSELQSQAIHRATTLLLEIVGGKAGPLVEVKKAAQLKTIVLRRDRLFSILGCDNISDKEVKELLQSLGFGCKKEKNQWQVEVPAWRFDVSLEEDLIEEVARLYGYDKIPATRPHFPLQTHILAENRIALPRVRRLLCDLGYHEVVTYSFVNEELQRLLNPGREPKPLVNPITADMTVMRTNLWPGLMTTYMYNRDRQQSRLRLFEMGLCFIQKDKQLSQPPMLGGLLSGSAFPEGWGSKARDLHFFDLKGDLENILQLTHLPLEEFCFKAEAHPALHPGQSAVLYRDDQPLGILGALHPEIRQKLGISEPIFLFEFNLDTLLAARPPYFQDISRFPEIRRDLALLADRQLPSQEIRDIIVSSGGEWLRQVSLFDVYLGEGVPKDKKKRGLCFGLATCH